MNRLAGKRAIITGAGSGIGLATARLFAAQGAQILAVDRDTSRLEGLAGEGAERIVPHHANCSRDADVAGIVEAALARFGGIDVIFANAGISGGAVPFLEQTRDEWEAILRTNLVGTFQLVQAGARAMISQGHGSIICTASVAGLRANAAGSPYSASKAGVISLVQTAANALAGSGLRVNAICPGLIETGMTRPLFERARERGTTDRIGQLNPLRRPGASEEVAAAALFLASDESSYVNGQAIAVDGGLTSTLPIVPAKSESKA
jgi:NAD(P)-dependent dehydrogenase (short-subunit alcohol dehydrogenase family)